MIGYLSLTLLALHASATPLSAHKQDNSLAITSLEKNVTSTSGTGNVAAAGNLAPFGNIGIGEHSAPKIAICR
jgi:hypothetical protein